MEVKYAPIFFDLGLKVSGFTYNPLRNHGKIMLLKRVQRGSWEGLQLEGVTTKADSSETGFTFQAWLHSNLEVPVSGL